MTNVVYTNGAQIAELCALKNHTDGIEVNFVESITGNADAFCGSSGIVAGRNFTDTTLAHEIGYACGLIDIYDTYSRETNLAVTGMPQKVYFTHDWVWYPESVTQAQLVQRLLMYGYNTDSAHKGDISRGGGGMSMGFGISKSGTRHVMPMTRHGSWALPLWDSGSMGTGIR